MSDGDARERETDAITKIQATFKGNKTREETAPMRAKWSGRSDMLKLWRSGLTRVRLRLMAARCLHIEDTFFAREYAVQYERHNLYLAKLRNGVSAAHGALNTYRDVKTSLLANAASKQFAGSGVVTEVTSECELANVAFWQQGDASLNTIENVKKRSRLRHSDKCVEVLDAFWRVANSLEGESSNGDESIVTKEGHAELFLRVHKVLLETFDLEEAEKDVQEDWLTDARGSNALLREPFADSMFELADSAFAWHELDRIYHSPVRVTYLQHAICS